MTHLPMRGVLLGDTETSGKDFKFRHFLGQIQSLDFYLLRWDGDGVLDETQPAMLATLPTYLRTGPHSIASLGAHLVNGLSTEIIADKENVLLPYEAALATQSILKRLMREGITFGFYNGSRFDCDVIASFLEDNLCDGRDLFPYHPYVPNQSGVTAIPSWQRQPLQFDLMHAARIFEYFYPTSFKPVNAQGKLVGDTGKISRSLLARVVALGGQVDATQAHGVEYDVRVLSRELFLRLWEIDQRLLRTIIACGDKQNVLQKLRHPDPEPVFVVSAAGKAGWMIPVPLPEARRQVPREELFSFEKGKVYFLHLDEQTDLSALQKASAEDLKALIEKSISVTALSLRNSNLIIGKDRAGDFGIAPHPNALVIKSLVTSAAFQERFHHAASATDAYPDDGQKAQRQPIDWKKRRRLRQEFHGTPWEKREALALAMDEEDRARAVRILFMQQHFKGSATPLLSEAGLAYLTIAPLDPLIAECHTALEKAGGDDAVKERIQRFLASETKFHNDYIRLRNALSPHRTDSCPTPALLEGRLEQ